MKLYGTQTSPFVRKVRMVAVETGLDASIEFVVSNLSPIMWDPQIVAVNPGGRVPTLVLDDGMVLFDSRVICRYLAAQSTQVSLYPQEAPAIWDILRREAMSDELMEPALQARYELALRPPELRWNALLETLLAKVDSVIDAAEAEPPPDQRFDAGDIGLACGLGYLDFRFPKRNWRATHPRLAEWFAGMSTRKSWQATGFSA